MLSEEEQVRYRRHLLLPEVGMEGQARLKNARVLLVGVGGLGSPVSLYLAAAGVGELGLVDDDRVELSNLQRQVLYGQHDLDRAKVEAARDRLMDLNPRIRVTVHDARLTAANARTILEAHDVIVDGTDNFASRYLINDACVRLGKPFVHGSVHRFEGQVTVLAAPHGPCYRCLFPEPPTPAPRPDSADTGILGVVPGILGTLQAAEVLKLILECGAPLIGRLLHFDALGPRFHTFNVPKDPHCPLCGSSGHD